MENVCTVYNSTNKGKLKEKLMRLLQTGIVPTEILARGPEALEAFNDALAEGETEVNQGKTVFLGLERVGKTSTIKSFLRNIFDPNEGITDAIANTTVCTHEWHDELNWEETSPEHSGASDMYEVKMADAIAKTILENQTKKNVVQVTEQSVLSPTTAETKYNQGQSSSNVDARNAKIESDIEKQTKTQMRPENISHRQMKEVPESIANEIQNVLKFTRDATGDWRKSGNKFIMNIWDFGGQPIYHVIQRIFMVSFAIVCVVFNLEDDLDAPAKVRDPTTGKMYQHRMTNLQFILYWIRSVYTNSRDSKLDDGQPSPPVLVIGTHLGSLDGNEEEQKRKAEEIFSKIRAAMEGKPYEALVFPTFFAIENSLPFNRSNASKIMEQILKFAKKMVRKLPLKWLLVQQEIQKLKVKHIYLPTKKVISLVERCGVKKDAQRVLLEYLHDLGEILYFPDDEALRDIIVLDLMQLVDMFKTIITVIDPKLMKRKYKEAWSKLDSGVLEEHLLRHLWEKFRFSDETFDFFVSLMQKFGLVCEKNITKSGFRGRLQEILRERRRIFYVLLRLKPEHVYRPSKDDGKHAISIFHDFGRYLPDDLFQRGVTKFIEKFQVQDNEPKLSYEHVELTIDELHKVVMSVETIRNRRMFKTTIAILEPSQQDEPSPTVCKKVLRFLEKELKLFCLSGVRGIELTRYIACKCSSDSSRAHMQIVRTFDEDVLPCGSNILTRYRKLFGDDVPLLQDRPQSQQVVHIPTDRPQSQQVVHIPTGFVDDATIMTVSDDLNLSWRRFGVRLGLKWSKVNKFNADDTQTHKAAENMMNYWRSSLSSDIHQRKVLCTALKQHKLRQLAEDFLKGEISDENVVPQQAVGKCFNDQDLLFICDNLDPESWRRLGVHLGLKWTDIKKIAKNNRLIEECIMELLVTWRDDQLKSQQVPILLKALRQQKLVGLAQSVCGRHGYNDEAEAAPTQINMPQIPTTVQGCLDDTDMVFISDKLDGNDLIKFGIYLGMEKNEISRIAADVSPPIVDACIEMLVQWRSRQETEVNHLKTISDALNKLERIDIKEELVSHYYKKYGKI
ncbi:uncharacterized protein LOC117103422 [Anneissia japonica]|uniref:uncharacterized protein LOC117103422 n=1 Tax=Anneissia japonica TaxID=1529436 RepID=UPI001425B0A1|nr:uncharacterized protein LOC117103422 [Anneissia japonica]